MSGGCKGPDGRGCHRSQGGESSWMPSEMVRRRAGPDSRPPPPGSLALPDGERRGPSGGRASSHARGPLGRSPSRRPPSLQQACGCYASGDGHPPSLGRPRVEVARPACPEAACGAPALAPSRAEDQRGGPGGQDATAEASSNRHQRCGGLAGCFQRRRACHSVLRGGVCLPSRQRISPRPAHHCLDALGQPLGCWLLLGDPRPDGVD
mmetsp:Transcript_148451/g.360352  ORF Transcript_148451/g.360352 Transcript_148451/m.360352 type:complete len:208 (-) Transcript_148451:497-1120(-)